MSKRKFIKVRVNITLEFFNQPKIPLGEEQVFEIPNIAAQEKQEYLEKRRKQLPVYGPPTTKPPDREIRFDENVRYIIPRTVRT